MRRRAFIASLPVAAAAPFAAVAQPAAKRPLIGFIGPNSDVIDSGFRSAFADRLAMLGWREGSTVTIDFRVSQGQLQRASEIAAEFASRKADVIVTGGDAQVLAAKKMAGDIPIVFGAAGDPVGNGLVASLARPGGNITGLSLSLTETAGKREELLREIVPNLRQLAILGNFGNPTVDLEMEAAGANAREDKIEVVRADFRKLDDLAPAIEALKGRVQAIYVCADPLTNSYAGAINSLALTAQLPVMYSFRDLAAAGGAISYGPDRTDMYRRAADMVDKILRGTKPADIPVEQPTKFTLLLNLKTTKALGLTIPQTILVTADEVIE